ncbi:hypothetical protein E2K93_14025 [Thalassotalea sp. HSM 43]|uniref:hypothetical protein n=1 Tax=Thalassotalea sp. HSM 43 TaxID=2552945 RepID=UPI0010820A10|nr:hypothetical protein [Thalassotalea sp. HSM 43]QBY05418.1 hypothetical protein E2K93_14025 [Thalassotalea sp. HSM 43]
MNHYRKKHWALVIGAVAMLIGAVFFALSWFVFDHDMPGYRIALSPGILFMKLFTEELDMGLKLVLLMAGQFVITAAVSYLLLSLSNWFTDTKKS